MTFHESSSERAQDTRRILIVEDDYFIAEDMRLAFQRAGAEVIGPVPTIEDAVVLIGAAARIDAAVLDINLEGDGLVFPIADALTVRGVPFVFATGYDDTFIPERFADVKRFEKPCNPTTILSCLTDLRPSRPT